MTGGDETGMLRTGEQSKMATGGDGDDTVLRRDNVPCDTVACAG